MQCLCKQCGKTFVYNDEVGYAEDICSPFCDGVHSQKAKIELLTKQRDAWHKACAVLYGECKEGGPRGRPCDVISKQAWKMIVQLIAAAEELIPVDSE